MAKDKLCSGDKAQELYWVWFQLKIKQAIHHLYLNMVGNIQAGFKAETELRELEARKNGYQNLSGHDIFDFDKYIKLLQSENSDNSKFMLSFMEKQSFITFIEDLYQVIRQREDRVKSEKPSPDCSKPNIKMFYQSLRYLVKHSSQNADSFVKFEDQALKRLRERQKEQIDQIFLTYKTPIPFKLNYVLEEYYKQVCQKTGVTVEQHVGIQQQVEKLLVGLMEASTSTSTAIQPAMITRMRGIDYNKIS